jgi:hypothetical protein
MRKVITTFIGSAVAASGIALSMLGAAPANAGCQGMNTPWGGGQRCDSQIDANGMFQRCDSGGVMGFALPEQCYTVDSKALGNNMPWIAP